MTSAKPSSYLSRLTRNTYLLALSSLFADISTEMLYPVLPIFLTQTLGASGSLIGLIEGVASATQNIVQGISGSISDKLRKRKSIALVGYVLAATGKPLMGVATIWQGVLLGRMVDRFGTGIRSAPRDALIASSVDEADRGKAFGLESAGDNTGAFLGPLLSVFLLAVLRINIRLIFYIAVIPGLLAFLMTALVRESAPPTPPKTSANISPRQYPAVYWRYLGAIGIFGIGNSSNAFLIMQIKSIGASLTTTILIYAAFNLIAALISYPAGHLADWLGRRNVLLIAFSIFFITYLGFALTRNIVLVGLLFMGYGIYQGIFRGVGKALASSFVPDQVRASGIGWYNACVGVFTLLASLLAGWLWDKVGHAAVFAVGATSALLGSIALALLVPSDRRPRSIEAA